MPVGSGAWRDDVIEAGEGEGEHGIELDAGVPLLKVAPPHPAVGDPRLNPPQQPHRVAPQDVAISQPRQLRSGPAAPRELPPPLGLLRVSPVRRVHCRAAHVERGRRRGLFGGEQISDSASERRREAAQTKLCDDSVNAEIDVRTEKEKVARRILPARVLPM